MPALGRLDDYVTRSGYVMTPVVLWTEGDVELTPDPGEVARVYRIGLHELCRDDSPRFVTIPESDEPVVQVPLGRDLIHAPTGAVLVQFRGRCSTAAPTSACTISNSQSSPGSSSRRVASDRWPPAAAG